MIDILVRAKIMLIKFEVSEVEKNQANTNGEQVE